MYYTDEIRIHCCQYLRVTQKNDSMKKFGILYLIPNYGDMCLVLIFFWSNSNRNGVENFEYVTLL